MACITNNIIYVSDIRAKSCAPLAAVFYAASGYMIEFTAEQKSFAKGKVFCLRWQPVKGEIPKGERLGSALLTFSREKVSARRHEALNSN